MTATDQEVGFAGVAAPLTGIRKIAARRMVEAWTAPVFHLGVDVDMSCGPRREPEVGRRHGDRRHPGVLHRRAAGAPGMNAHFADNVVTTFADVNIGLAVATEKGSDRTGAAPAAGAGA